MNHRFLMKRAALLLFAGLFGLATLQTATAQDSDDHDVTIQVDNINELTVDGNPTIDIGQNIGEWRADDDAATYDVETNVQSARKITVSASQPSGSPSSFLPDAENYGLRVSAATPGTGAGSGVNFEGSGSVLNGRGSGSSFVLTDVGSGFSGNAQDLITGFQQVGAFNLALDYEAKVNYKYDPNKDATVNVTYTLISN